MSTESFSPAVTPALVKKPRFSWPMRLFLSFLVFDMVFHSLAVLTPYRDWLRELKMTRLPKELPSHKEMAELREKAQPGDPDPVWQRYRASLASLPEFFNPWPNAKVREKLIGTEEWCTYGFCWVTTRLTFFNNVAGFDQSWQMFSPNVRTGNRVPRLRLLYKDGTTLDLRLLCDPDDLTSYAHWFEEKLLDAEIHLCGDYDARLGYCNFVFHKYGQNANGAKLDKIYIYKVWYDFPTPDEDYLEVLSSQNGPPGWDEDGPNWVYEADTREMYSMSKSQRKLIQQELALVPSLGEITPSYP